MTTHQNLEFERGDDEGGLISFFEDTFEQAPIALTDLAAIELEVFEDQTLAVLTFSASLGDGILSYSESEAKFTIPAAVTSAATNQRPYFYRVRVTTQEGVETTQHGFMTFR